MINLQLNHEQIINFSKNVARCTCTEPYVEKEPENADFLRTLGEALYHTEDQEHAEVILLRAFDLSIATLNNQDLQTTEIVQSLIQLYEVWGKPEKADEWRAKLPQTEALEK